MRAKMMRGEKKENKKRNTQDQKRALAYSSETMKEKIIKEKIKAIVEINKN
jgi:hypothetical protein